MVDPDPKAEQMLMKKIFGAVLLSVLGFAALASSQKEVAYAAGGAAPAASGHDPVQHCLDQVQLNLAGKITPALPVMSHPVQSPPKDLPIHCLAGNLTEIKNALKNQIANCQRKSAKEKAQTFQFGCRMVKNEDYCLNANTEMLKIASQPNMNLTGTRAMAAKVTTGNLRRERRGLPSTIVQRRSTPPLIHRMRTHTRFMRRPRV